MRTHGKERTETQQFVEQFLAAAQEAACELRLELEDERRFRTFEVRGFEVRRKT